MRSLQYDLYSSTKVRMKATRDFGPFNIDEVIF